MAHLDEEIVAVHFEIVELQRSPFARRQVDVMEQLCVSLEFIILRIYSFCYNVITIIMLLSALKQNNIWLFYFRLQTLLQMCISPLRSIDCLFVFHREEKAIELYKQLKAKCKSECV